jgi:hypothetical protein
MDVNTAPTAASKALPPFFRISNAVWTVDFSPPAIAPYFIIIHKDTGKLGANQVWKLQVA